MTLSPELQGEFQRPGDVGMRCVQHVAHGQGSAGIRDRELGSLWWVHGGVGTPPVLRAAGLKVLMALSVPGKGAESGTPKSEPQEGKEGDALGMLIALPAGDVGVSPRFCCVGNCLLS